MILHPFPPLYDDESTILILGSFPSVKSREVSFFYGHPQNRFWKVTSAVMGENCPTTIDEKAAFLHRNHIALWDTIHSCEIVGSSDSSIRNVVPNDLFPILTSAQIRTIYTNGRKSHELYQKCIEPNLGRPAVYLPSTSPANAGWSLERLIEAWSIIRNP